MVTTIEYREDKKQYTSVFVPHPANPGGMYPMKDSSDSDKGEATKITTLLKINFVTIQNITIIPLCIKMISWYMADITIKVTPSYF